jgi:Iap family predicted aminopeptidase
MGDGGEMVVVGAHYDAKWLNDGTLSKGAVDNGASSVVLVHAAEALRGQALPRRVKFVWFDLEESGLAGSAKYVEAHAADPIVAMLNYDINGYGNTVLYGPPMGGDDASLELVMAVTCANLRIDCLRFDAMPPGDDRSFGARKIPTLSIGMLPAIEVHQLWLMLFAKGAGLTPGFQPPIFGTIHTTADVPEKLDGAGMAMAQRLAVSVIRAVCAMTR